MSHPEGEHVVPHEGEPTTEHTPPPVPEPPQDDLRAIVTELKTQVSELAGQVASLIDSTDRDTTPTKVPWTHRKWS